MGAVIRLARDFRRSEPNRYPFKPWTLTLVDYSEMLSRLTVNKPGLMTRGYFLGAAALFLLIGIGSVAAAVRFLLDRRGFFKAAPHISA